jgi:hypothetical protein
MSETFRCPTKLQVFRQLLMTLPRGKAWQSSEPAGQAFTATMAQSGFAQAGMFQTLYRPLTVMHAFWSAVADYFHQLTQLLCALRLEFWCATQSQTRDLWLAEYGLPDACDPFPDLCAKVSALGGTDCNYYRQTAARAGWSISCEPLFSAICFQLGTFQLGDTGLGGEGGAATIRITVDLLDSTAFQGGIENQPQLGAFQLGNTLNCGPDFSPLVCLLDRIVHAHVAVIYQTA